MAFWLLLGPTALLVAFTLLPLWKSEAWWVRGADFPRLQFAALAFLLLVIEVVFLDLSRLASWLLVAVTLACFLYQGWWILPYTRLYRQEVRSAGGADTQNRLSIMVANVLMSNRNAEGLLDIVRAHRPDVLLAIETDRWWQDRFDALEREWPHSLKHPLDNRNGMLLYSRLPLEEPEVEFLLDPGVPSLHALVVLASGVRVRLHCLHPPPPSPTEKDSSGPRDAELVVVGRNVAGSDLPVVVMGDLNDVAWSATTRLFRKVSGLLDPRVGRGMYNTFHARYPFMRWPLDHLFHSDHFTLVRLQRLGAFGSDHFPILVELAYEPARSVQEEGLEPSAEEKEWAEEKANSAPADKDDVPEPGE
jgi:endonuclease/exonuclease/phosphatase (EEP) superfamily protein YafD